MERSLHPGFQNLNPWLLYEVWCYTVGRNVGCLHILSSERPYSKDASQALKVPAHPTEANREVSHICRICFDIALCCGVTNVRIAWCLAAALRSNPRPSALVFGATWRRRNSRRCRVDGNATASTAGGLLNDISESWDELSDLMWLWRSRAFVIIWEVRLSAGHGVTWFTSVITRQ